MNERIAKLYDQAIVLEGNGDYVAGELDPVKFAELIVLECAYIADQNFSLRIPTGQFMKKYFGGE